jgi:Sep-tRNA:Cys-tRNA synthetase
MLLTPVTPALERKFSSPIRKNRDFINIMPLQTGSLLDQTAKTALMEYGDGYAICDHCNGCLEKIQNPPVADLLGDILPRFLDCDTVRLTTGAREGKFMVFHALTNPGDTVLVDANRHYSTYIAAERLGLNVIEVPNSGYPEYRIDVKDYIPLIEQYRPKLVLLTYPDGNYGNLPDAKLLAGITQQYNLPFLLNGAYAVGRLPVCLEETGADFIVASAHKSMAASGPLGVLGMKKKWEEKVLKKSGRYSRKEIESLGCTSRGAGVITLMASMPRLIERVQAWDQQVEKAQWFSRQMEKLGMNQLGEKKHRHDLMTFESPLLYEISQSCPQKGYFLYKELKKRRIWGIKPGRTRKFKISTFAAAENELETVVDAFKDIIAKYG